MADYFYILYIFIKYKIEDSNMFNELFSRLTDHDRACLGGRLTIQEKDEALQLELSISIEFSKESVLPGEKRRFKIVDSNKNDIICSCRQLPDSQYMSPSKLFQQIQGSCVFNGDTYKFKIQLEEEIFEKFGLEELLLNALFIYVKYIQHSLSCNTGDSVFGYMLTNALYSDREFGSRSILNAMILFAEQQRCLLKDVFDGFCQMLCPRHEKGVVHLLQICDIFVSDRQKPRALLFAKALQRHVKEQFCSIVEEKIASLQELP